MSTSYIYLSTMYIVYIVYIVYMSIYIVVETEGSKSHMCVAA